MALRAIENPFFMQTAREEDALHCDMFRQCSDCDQVHTFLAGLEQKQRGNWAEHDDKRIQQNVGNRSVAAGYGSLEALEEDVKGQCERLGGMTGIPDCAFIHNPKRDPFP